MKYKLIVLDLDGTLTNSKKEISSRNRETLIRIQEQGIRPVSYTHLDVYKRQGNSSIHGQKFQYPALETLVSRLGNASVPPWERQFPA